MAICQRLWVSNTAAPETTLQGKTPDKWTITERRRERDLF